MREKTVEGLLLLVAVAVAARFLWNALEPLLPLLLAACVIVVIGSRLMKRH